MSDTSDSIDMPDIFKGLTESYEKDSDVPSEFEVTRAFDLLKRAKNIQVTQATHEDLAEDKPSPYPPQLAAAIETLAPPGEGSVGVPQGNSCGQQLTFNKARRVRNRSMKYQAEIECGLRLKTGKKVLSCLNGPHYMCISLHLCGFKQVEIAETVKRTVSWVSFTLNDPLAKAEIIRRSIMLDGELFALQGDVVEALRSALSDIQEPAVRLRAAEQWFKVHGRFQKAEEGRGFTAEDVVRQVLERQQINIAAAKAETHVHVHLDSDKPTVLIEGGA